MSGRAIRAVLFDWGDTLFASPPAPPVILAAARARGIDLDPARADRIWRELWDAGKSAEEHAKGRDLSLDAHRRIWTDLFRRAERDVPGVAEALYDRVMDPSSWRPYADTGPTLRALRDRGVRVGVVSNVPADLRPIFARHGLGDLVDAYALSFEHGVQKPASELFHAACASLGVTPPETLMVGDDPVSDAGAAGAGLRVYLLPPDGRGETRGLAAVVALVDDANPPHGGGTARTAT